MNFNWAVAPSSLQGFYRPQRLWTKPYVNFPLIRIPNFWRYDRGMVVSMASNFFYSASGASLLLPSSSVLIKSSVLEFTAYISNAIRLESSVNSTHRKKQFCEQGRFLLNNCVSRFLPSSEVKFQTKAIKPIEISENLAQPPFGGWCYYAIQSRTWRYKKHSVSFT